MARHKVKRTQPDVPAVAENLAATIRHSTAVFQGNLDQGQWLRISLQLEREEKRDLLEALAGLIDILDRWRRTLKEFGEVV